MSPRFAPAALLPMLVLLAGVSGCPGHLDQIGWAEPDAGFSAYQPGNTGGSGGSAPSPGTGGSGPSAGTGGSTASGTGGSTGTGGTGMTKPPVKADAGAAPDASAPKPDAMAVTPPTPDAGIATPTPTPVCATATEIAEKILTPKCGTCHGKNAPAAGLDLVTAGVKMRLVNITARGCAGKMLVTDGSQVGGHFFDKLYGGVANCGGQMPFGAAPLSPEEIKCLKDWIKPTP